MTPDHARPVTPRMRQTTTTTTTLSKPCDRRARRRASGRPACFYLVLPGAACYYTSLPSVDDGDRPRRRPITGHHLESVQPPVSDGDKTRLSGPSVCRKLGAGTSIRPALPSGRGDNTISRRASASGTSGRPAAWAAGRRHCIASEADAGGARGQRRRYITPAVSTSLQLRCDSAA